MEGIDADNLKFVSRGLDDIRRWHWYIYIYSMYVMGHAIFCTVNADAMQKITRFLRHGPIVAVHYRFIVAL